MPSSNPTVMPTPTNLNRHQTNVTIQQPRNARNNVNPTPVYYSSSTSATNCCDPLTCYLCMDCTTDCCSSCKKLFNILNFNDHKS